MNKNFKDLNNSAFAPEKLRRWVIAAIFKELTGNHITKIEELVPGSSWYIEAMGTKFLADVRYSEEEEAFTLFIDEWADEDTEEDLLLQDELSRTLQYDEV